MEIDKKVIKALSSDTRVRILKALTQRRKMPSELAKELDLAGSTVVEHLKTLEGAGLIVRKDTGRKWIYYELTSTGEGLIKPRFPVQFVMVLSLGLLFVFSGFVKFFLFSGEFAALQRSSEAGGVAGSPAIFVAEPDYVMIALFAIGLIIIILGFWKFRNR